MGDPPPVPGTADAPPARRRRTVRIRTLMVAIAWLAAWLALWRASPALVIIALVMAGPTLALRRFLLSGMGWDGPGEPGLFDRQLTLVVAAIIVALGLALLLVWVGALRP